MKKNQIILIIIGVLILAGLVASFGFWLKYFAPKTGEVDLCTKFTKIEGEISCQEAKEIALEEYLGEVLEIDKATTSYQYGRPPEIKTEPRDVWIIKIKLKEPFLSAPDERGSQRSTEEIGVVVDRHQEKILFLQAHPL